MLKQISKKNLIFKIISAPKLNFNPQDERDVSRLEKGSKFVYERKFNKKRTKVKLMMHEVALLNGQLGVYANQYIGMNKGKPIGCYAGKHINVNKPTPNNDYVFEISDDEGNELELIDGYKLRDWSNFVNHSNTPNLDVIQRKSKGVYNIYFYPRIPIKKGDQLFFDYGPYYFNGRKHIYMHVSDNWQDAETIYMTHLQYYALGTYTFGKPIGRDLKLKGKSWLIPTIFLHVFKNDTKALKKALKKGAPVDLLAFAVSNNKISKRSDQEHLTALMFACYLGREECIEVLIKHKADNNRTMLNCGYLPLTLLCKGLADNRMVARIGQQLLKKMHTPFVIDRDKRSILYYAVIRNLSSLVRLIVARIKRDDEMDNLSDIAKGIDRAFLKQITPQQVRGDR